MGEPSIGYVFVNGSGNYIDADEVNANNTSLLNAIKSASTADLGCGSLKVAGETVGSHIVTAISGVNINLGTVVSDVVSASSGLFENLYVGASNQEISSFAVDAMSGSTINPAVVTASQITVGTMTVNTVASNISFAGDASFSGRIVKEYGELDSPGQSATTSLLVNKPYYLYSATHPDQTGGYTLIGGLYVGQKVEITRTAASGPVYCTVKFGYNNEKYDIEENETVAFIYAGGTNGWCMAAGVFADIYT